jgi:hypothetical protein
MAKIDEILEKRGERYGDYVEQAEIVEKLIDTIRKSPNWEEMPATHRVAFYLICLKIGRVCTGDVMYADNFVDIEGYARLVANELER